MRDYTLLMKRMCIAMGIYTGGATLSCSKAETTPPAQVAAADTTSDTFVASVDTFAPGDLGLIADTGSPEDSTPPEDPGTVSEDLSPPEPDVAPVDDVPVVEDVPPEPADVLVPADEGAPDTVATGDTAAPTCPFGDPVATCYTATQLKFNIENPPFGGDAAPPPYEGVLPPEGCPEPGLVLDGCCNAAVGPGHLVDDTCCYEHCQGACCGRPLVVDGAARVADLESGSSWSPASSNAPASGAAAEALAAVWRRDAADEHASVASFLRFGLELMHLGAPPALVTAATQAAQDEVRHAELACRVASSLDGRTLGPGPLPCGDVRVRTDWADIVAACVREGCIGETIASAQLAAAARRAPADLAASLLTVAEDEARHAELAWSFVAWSWRQGGARVRTAIARAFDGIADAPLAADPREAALAGVSDDERARAGRLERGMAGRVARATLRDVVAPCARALMASASVDRAGVA